MGCQTVQIPNFKLHAEIPFSDGAEGAYVETIENKTGIIPAEEWAKQRPYMLMIHIDDWAKIKKSWLKACRMVGSKKCNVAVGSIENVVRTLDRIAGGILGGTP